MTGVDLVTDLLNPVDPAASDPAEHQGIRVEPATGDTLDRWDDIVDRSWQATPFHRLPALRAQAAHTGTTLVPLLGYKGQEPVGAFPLFAGKKAGVAAAFSPAPGLWIASLGPVLVAPDGLKRRRAETRHRRFVRAALTWLDRAVDPRYVHLSTSGRYDDPRPFEWHDFRVRPRYTYVVDLTPGPDALLSAFSSDARGNVTGDNPPHEIEVGDSQTIRRIVDQVRRRYEEQDKSFTLPAEFVIDLYNDLPGGTVRPYGCWREDAFVGGMIVLAAGDTVYRWQGGAKTDVDLPVNDLLDWRIVRDAAEEGFERYDMVGANERRLCEYKSKFAPTLETYYQLERGPSWFRFGARLYSQLLR